MDSTMSRGSPPLQRRRRGAPPGRGRGNGQRKGRAPKFTAGDVIQALRRGQSFDDIARARGVTIGTVTRTFCRATVAQLEALYEGPTTEADEAGALTRGRLAPVTFTTTVDVTEIMIEPLERARGIERFLDDPPPGVVLGMDYRLKLHFRVMGMKLQWAQKFVDMRLKLLQLISVDTWIQELLAMVEEVDLELGRELEAHGIPLANFPLGLKGRLLERIRLKLVGPPRAATPTETTVETEAPDA